MISFPCSQCGQTLERAAGDAGTLVYCECGAGNTVPWESTPPLAEEVPAGLPQPSPLAELLGDEPPLKPRWEQTYATGPEWEEEWRPAAPASIPPPLPRAEPTQCLNHPSAARAHVCADCGCSFCADCVATFQGAVVCGPCKNLRMRKVIRPPRLSLMALFAPIIALVCGGVWLFVMLMVAGMHGAPDTALMLGGLGLLPQVFALAMGAMALHTIETEPNVSGRDWAMSGMIAALVSSAATIALTVFAVYGKG